MATTSTHIRRHIGAPRADVYRALLNPELVREWKVPVGMRCQVHAFEAREGGRFRVSLTYDRPTGTGKTTAQTDTYHGRFVRLVPDERVVEVVEFETGDPAMAGELVITWVLRDSAAGGTELEAVHENVPPGVSPAENQVGWEMAVGKLAGLVESGRTGRFEETS
jgi:uncharacterized protein YndB with AHSA1/START domain